MEAREYKLDGLIVLELKGRVDEFNTRVLGDELRTIINTGRFRIVVDMKKVDFLSAHCLREIWKVQNIARSKGGDIVLVGASGGVGETVRYVDFPSVVQCFEDLDKAHDYLATASDDAILNFNSTPVSLTKKIKTLFSISTIKKLIGLTALAMVSFCATTKASVAVASIDSVSYSLEEAMSLARETSPAIKLARLRMAEREAEVRMARSTGLPKIIGTGGYLYQSNPTVLGDIVNREMNNIRNPTDDLSSSQFQTRTRFNISKDAALMGLGFSQIVYSGGLFENQLSLREAQRREADAQVAIESLNVEEQVRNLYLGLLLNREKLKFLAAHKSALDQRKIAASRAYSMKTMSAIQFSEIEIQLLKSQQDELVAKKDEQNVRGLLNILLGRPIDANIEPQPVRINFNFQIESSDHYFEIAMHRYPELRRTSALMDSASAYYRVVDSQSNFSPQALVFGSVEQTYGLGSNKQDTSWTLGFGIYVPLYDGRKSGSELEKAASLSSQARLSYLASERKLQIDINEAVAEVQRSRVEIQLAEKAVEIASRKKVEANAAIRQGQLPQYRMSEVLAQEIEAKMTVIAAQSDFFRWRSKLLMLTGQREF